MMFLNERLTGKHPFPFTSSIGIIHDARMRYPEYKWTMPVLLRWLDHFQCYDIRDRIYSLLSVVYFGSSLAVDYNEDAYSLFWRCGEHFQAWADPRYVEILQVAIIPVGGLASYRRLAASKPQEITVHAKWTGLWNVRGHVFRSAVTCDNCEGQIYPLQGLSTGDTGLVLLFCVGYGGNFGHAVIVEDSGPNPFRLRVFPLVPTFIPVCVAPQDLDPGSLLQSHGGGWVETRRMRDFKSLVRESKDYESVKYKLKVPADAILILMTHLMEHYSLST